MSYDDWKLASPEDYAVPCEHCVHWERETDIFYCCECGEEGRDEFDSWTQCRWKRAEGEEEDE